LETDFLHWDVAKLDGGEVVGKVVEIIGAPKEGVGHALLNIETTNASEHKLIPLVRDIIPTYNRATCVLYLDPPAGLLDLDSENIEIDELQWLKQELEALHRAAAPSSSVSGLTAGHLPNSSQFRSLQRLDLLKIVERYGGHYEVAACLGLKPFKNPPGYWDLDSIELEVRNFLELFWEEDINNNKNKPRGDRGDGNEKIGSLSSRQQTHSLTGEKRFDSLSSPSTTTGTTSLLAKELLPNCKLLLEHERHDLVYAIKMNGGFRSTAKELGRMLYSPQAVHRQRLSRDFGYLAEQMEDLIIAHPECSSESGADADNPEGRRKTFPTQRLVRELGRHDLDRAISHHGGYTQVAQRMRVKATFSHQRGYWHSAENVVKEVREFLATSKLGLSLDQSQCPKYTALEKAGRHDLKYGVEVHGRKEITQMMMQQEEQHD
jgi:hypothetical protein